jgi:hypothetical protein
VNRRRRFTPQTPALEAFRGKPLRVFLQALCEWAARVSQHLNIGPPGKPAALLVTTPGGGIPAYSAGTPGSATCTILKRDGTTADSVTVLNRYTAAIGGTKICAVVLIGGEYYAITEQC